MVPGDWIPAHAGISFHLPALALPQVQGGNLSQTQMPLGRLCSSVLMFWPKAGLKLICYPFPQEWTWGIVSTGSRSPDSHLGSFLLACNVLFVNSVDMESLTGPQAISKATSETLAADPTPAATIVHFKVSSQGITLTDNQRK